MAAARFQRNQRLLCEIFNEVCIPDLRSNVNVDRILTLRRQVDALKTHRETFEKDLNELEEKHAEKKRKFIEANEKFHNEYAEASSTDLSREKIEEILQKYEAMEKLQKEKQLLLQQQQAAAAAAISGQQIPTDRLGAVVGRGEATNGVVQQLVHQIQHQPHTSTSSQRESTSMSALR